MIQPSTPQQKIEHWVGADVAKATFTAALVQPGQKWPATPLRDLPTRTFARTPAGLENLLAWLEKSCGEDAGALAFGVVMESTGKYSVELAAWMLENHERLQPAIVNPQQTHAYIKSMNLRSKTDALEARALAFYGVERTPAPYEPLRPEQRQLRELVRHRKHLVDQGLALSNRKGEGSESKFVQQAQKRLVGHFERETKKTEAAMRTLVAKHPEIAKDIELLSSIYGVAFLTAATILAELGDLRRFERGRQLSAFVGLSPHQTQSGSSINKPGRLSKKGNSPARKALYMAALTAIHDKGHMQATYLRLVAEGKPKMVAIGAVMRKLLLVMRAILISGESYDPLWKTSEKLQETGAEI